MAKTTTSTKKSGKSTVKQSKRPGKASIKTPQKPRKPSKQPKAVTKPVKSAKPVPAKKLAPKFNSPYPRASANPFRDGSSYGVVFDVLHAHPDGISRGQLIGEVAKICKLDERHSTYNCSVLLSAKQDGSRHQSCRGGFYVEKTNSHLILHVTAVPAPKPVAG